jgi:glucose-6-phosphate-specific signal transduction histidine kinase
MRSSFVGAIAYWQSLTVAKQFLLAAIIVIGCKHAGGRGQALIASRQDGDIHIEVVDDGPGFRWARSGSPGRHLGLIGLQNRILALGGSFDVRSEPGAGTRLIANIPFHNGASNDVKEDPSWNHRRSPVDA